MLGEQFFYPLHESVGIGQAICLSISTSISTSFPTGEDNVIALPLSARVQQRLKAGRIERLLEPLRELGTRRAGGRVGWNEYTQVGRPTNSAF